MSLDCLIYVSLANQEMSDDHLQTMLQKSSEGEALLNQFKRQLFF